MRYPIKDQIVKRNAVLLFNDNESLFIYNKVGLDSVQPSVSMETQENKDKIFDFIRIEVKPIDEKGMQIYRNFPLEIIVFRYPKHPPSDPYTVRDNWVKIPWNIKKDYKMISGWKCQKAIGNFRGRQYVVWFSEQIPFPYGPWKLFGLPGMILEAKDTTGEVYMRIKSLCYPCEKEIKIEKPLEPKQKTLREYVEFYDHYIINVEQIYQSKLGAYKEKVKKTSGRNINVQIDMVTNPRSENDIRAYRKKRLEIIYEWENKNTLKNADDIQIKKEDVRFKK